MKRLLAGIAALAVVVAGAIGVQRSLVGTERPSEGKQPILKSGYDGLSKVNSEDDNRDGDRKTFEKQMEVQARQQQKAFAELRKHTQEASRR